MRILLDTHTALWLDADRKRISSRAYRTLSAGRCEIWFSAVSCAEMAVKIRRGKLRLEESLIDWIEDRTQRYRWQLLDLRPAHTHALVALGSDHRDPFDLLLAAQARAEKLTLATADPAFDALGISLLSIG